MSRLAFGGPTPLSHFETSVFTLLWRGHDFGLDWVYLIPQRCYCFSIELDSRKSFV